MDIKKIIESQVDKVLESGDLEELISKSIETSIKKVVEDKFSGYNFRNELEKKLNQELEPITEYVSFSGYRDLIIDRIKKILSGLIDSDLIEKAEKAYKDLFFPANEPLKLSTIFEDVRSSYINDYKNKYEQYFYLDFISKDERDDFKWLEISFSESPTDEKNIIKLLQYKDAGFKIVSLKTDNLDYDLKNKALLKIKYLKSYERLLLNAFINEQVIDMDISEEDIDTSL